MTAQRAAGHAFVVNLALGTLAFASVLFVIARLAAVWRVGTGQVPHSLSLFGQTWRYPVANAGAIAVTALAGLGVVVLAVAVRAAVRELRTDARCRQALAQLAPSAIGRARIIEDDRPHAFCAGLLNPCVYVSRGALEMLDDAELRAVLAHEHHHARCRDPLRLAAARVLGEALFFVPPLRDLIRRQHALAEIGADEAAVAAAGGASVASAMLSFSEAAAPGSMGLAPERVDHLASERRVARYPFASLLVAFLLIAALVALTTLLAGAARGSATLALPLASAQPCVATLALIPAWLAGTGLVFARRLTRPDRAAVERGAADS